MNSSSYWRKREEKWIQQQMKEDAKQSQIIAEKYQKALDQIQKEIDANWERFAGKEGVTLSEAKKLALEMDVKSFSRKAKQYVKEKNFSKTANDELRLYNVTMRTSRLELLKSQLGLELIALSDDLDTYTADTLTKSGTAEAKRQAGISGETVFTDYEKFIDIVANASFQGATFSERIWGNLGALKADLDRLLIRSITQGRNPRELARELRNLFNSSKFEAERLMRTETARVQIAVQMKSYQESEIDEYLFIAEPDACKICASIAKKSEKEPLEVENHQVGLNAPPIHPNCRCSTVPFMDSEPDMVYNKDETGPTIASISKMLNKINLESATPEDLIDIGAEVEKLHKVSDHLGDKTKLTEIFGNYRPMGGSIPENVWYARSNKLIKNQLQEAFSFYPKQWAKYVTENNKSFFAGKTDRGFFQRELVNSKGRRLLKGASLGEGISIYSSGNRATTAYHEIGHMVDYFNSNLIRIERQFVENRTKGENATALASLFPGYGYGVNEKTRKDNFISPYVGKDYGDRATEVLSIGLESIYEPGLGHIQSVDKNGNQIFKKISDDPEYMHLIIGLILKG